MFSYQSHSIILIAVRLTPQLHVENFPIKTLGTNLCNSSINKKFNQFESNKFYSTILSTNWKSSEGVLNKNTSVVSKIM